MQQLKKEIEKKIEDYQRRLKTTKTMLANSGNVSDSIFVTRLTAKASCYRTIISELEKVIEDTGDLPEEMDNKLLTPSPTPTVTDKLYVGDDKTCPVTKKHCEDKCWCFEDAECNLRTKEIKASDHMPQSGAIEITYIKKLMELWDLLNRRSGFCRDCADATVHGVCDTDNMPCDPQQYAIAEIKRLLSKSANSTVEVGKVLDKWKKDFGRKKAALKLELDDSFRTMLISEITLVTFFISDLEKVLASTPDLPGMEECFDYAKKLNAPLFHSVMYHQQAFKQLITFIQTSK